MTRPRPSARATGAWLGCPGAVPGGRGARLVAGSIVEPVDRPLTAAALLAAG